MRVGFLVFFFLLQGLEASGLAEDGAPKLTPVVSATPIAGASLWLFAVEDGEGKVVVSAEHQGRLLMGRLDLNQPEAKVDWKVVLDPSEIQAPSLADHWHIFAHGAHWIVVSTPFSGSYLLKLDRGFNRLGLFSVAPGQQSGPDNVPTNDMFLVEEPQGVAVGHFLPGRGHRIFRFDPNGNPLGTVDFGGGTFTHANGASAQMAKSGFRVFAPHSLHPLTPSPIYLIWADPNWTPVDGRILLEEPDTNFAMPTAVELASGHWIVHARVRDLTQTEPQAEPGFQMPDDGAIVRYVLDPEGSVLSREVLMSEGGNRPHTSLIGDLLVTTWDAKGSVWLRMDKV